MATDDVEEGPVPVGVFFDSETLGPLQLDLSRLDVKRYRLPRQFGYRDRRYDEPFHCPNDPEVYETDLSSTPWFFSWVIPDLGQHFPAIMLHDALVVGEGQPATHLGPELIEPKRVEADRIMRDAMRELGVGFVRRWLAWTGAMLATVWSTLQPQLWWRTLVVATFGLITVIGVISTLDLFDVVSWIPWMGDRSTIAELLLGGVAAVLIPLGLSVLWWRYWGVAAIGGIALAFVLQITISMIIVYLLYRFAEWGARALGLTKDGSGSTDGITSIP